MTLPSFARRVDDGLELRVKVVPGASRDQLAGILGDRLKLRVSAPPEAGKANRAVCALIGDWLGTTRVTVHCGTTSAEKTLLVHGRDRIDDAELAELGRR